MTKARFLRASSVEQLRADIPKNLEKYRKGDFSDLAVDQSYWFEFPVEVDEAKLSAISVGADGSLNEVANCTLAYDALSELSPYLARDERLWVYLSHTVLLAYTRARWPIPENDADAVKHIHKHFFARDKRQVERDNTISRLWWMGQLCARVGDVDREKALEAFLYRSDVRANLVERPTTSQSIEIFGAIIRRLVASYASSKTLFERRTFRDLMIELNSVGGYRLLECLSRVQIESIIDGIIKNRLKLASL
jgi:hypothetical protein